MKIMWTCNGQDLRNLWTVPLLPPCLSKTLAAIKNYLQESWHPLFIGLKLKQLIFLVHFVYLYTLLYAKLGQWNPLKSFRVSDVGACFNTYFNTYYGCSCIWFFITHKLASFMKKPEYIKNIKDLFLSFLKYFGHCN